jgi:mRNA interferase RelE/StbE
VGSFSVRIKASAAKEIEAIEPRSVRQRVIERIEALAEDPRPPGCEKLSAQQWRYRIRQGAWRVVYAIEDERLVVLVVKVGHRREVYR